MALGKAELARIAFQRFGLGPKRGGFEDVVGNPIRMVKAELEKPGIALIDPKGLPTTATILSKSQTGFSQAEEFRQMELKARMHKHMKPTVGFVERLVLFWSNHFSMSVNKSETVRGTIGQFEREVIRPNVLGSFPKMLREAIQHPAMIDYLDNDDSIGPNSTSGRAWNAGLNENLAREIMELHTLGSGAGYTEGDVTQLSRIITGWSYVRGWEAQYHYNGGTMANRGRFMFRPKWHEPGPIRLRGKVYPGGREEQGLAALRDLALAPATAQHLAFKLIRHFITDEPTPEMVAPVAAAYRASRGDLKATTLAMLDLPEAFTAPLTKVRTPYELTIAQFRAFGTFFGPKNGWAVYAPLDALHHLPWERPTPDGYPDETAYWLDPDGMTIRLDSALLFFQVYGRAVGTSPMTLARGLFGDALSNTTRKAILAAPDRAAGFVTLLMSPEFQRR